METAPAGVYEPRDPRATSLYALVEDYYEEFERVYDDRCQRLACPKCGGRLRIVRFIEDSAVIEKILRHLRLWYPPERPPPRRCSRTLEADADFLAWEAASRLFDGID